MALLEKHPKNRSNKELLSIVSLLEETQLSKIYKNHFKSETNAMKQVMQNCTHHMKLQFVPQNEYLCKKGEPGDYFWLILRGSVDVLKINKYEYMMSIQEYYFLIYDYYKNNDYNLLNETIFANFNTYPVYRKDFLNMNETLKNVNVSKNKKIITINSEEKNFEKILKEVQDKKLKMKLTTSPLDSSMRILEYEEESEGGNDNSDKKLCTIYSEEYFVRKKQGEYLGDLALDVNNGVRSNSCRAVEDCYLATLDRKDYTNLLREEKAKIQLREVEFLIKHFIFKKISKIQFDRKYINEFTLENYKKGSKIVKENDEVKHVYFIKEGDIQMNFNKNLLELNVISKSLNKLKSVKNQQLKYLLKNGNYTIVLT